MKPNLHIKSIDYSPRLEKELLVATCSGDVKGFPDIEFVESRINCFGSSGEVHPLGAFLAAVEDAKEKILILDKYFLKPEEPKHADKKKLLTDRVELIKNLLFSACIEKSGVVIRILADEPQHTFESGTLKETLNSIICLANRDLQQGQAAHDFDICFQLTNKFDKVHDRFAIIDGELWHFGGTVGGFNSKLSAASRGWCAKETKAEKFFNEVWKRCNN